MDSEIMDDYGIPIIDTDESLFSIIPKLSKFIRNAVGDVAFSFDDMSHESRGHRLRQLVHALAEDTHNPFIIVALMILKWEFLSAADDDWGLNESRGEACEFVAWQFLCHLNQIEAIDFLLEELPIPRRSSTNFSEVGRDNSEFGLAHDTEATPLLTRSPTPLHLLGFGRRSAAAQRNQDYSELYGSDHEREDFSRYFQFFGLNALEIAAVAQAKRFLSQRVVQRMVNDIWKGEIVFWDSLTVHSTKKPQIFNRKTADPYSRLRVPVYRKMFEAGFFLSLLFLYYSVLVERSPTSIGRFEILMDIWIVAFAYDELSGIVDAGVLFYQMDFWSLWNLAIIGVGFAFIITRGIGLAKNDDYTLNLSFDILSLEALFLVPRICSLVSLNSYFGSLIPVMKEMTKAFLRFLPVVLVLYTAFLTTFSLLARDRFSVGEMSFLLLKVFFGSPTLGLDNALKISPIFGYGLMLIFIPMSNFLLLACLISLMGMSLEGVMAHAREEYLFQLSIYVLESSNSRRLTYFLPPLNLIPLLCIRPLRLFLSAGTVRRVRIVLLRATHLPFVMMIWFYESSLQNCEKSPSRSSRPFTGRPPSTAASDPSVTRFQAPLHPSMVQVNRMKLGHERLNAEPYDANDSNMAAPGQTQFEHVLDAVERLRVQVERVNMTLAAQQRDK
ncbi:hypothetical protein N7466_010281 [Penicillium verhagenii]|uniref:uncharacterized protein n=1 Tax=Penicillium verhagenii TaxID=1562060 RepID=UPI002544DE85|nr:uncharacterized protein N7466_010281 [Penicillium verhagenii]KAJ5919338.1 hypothetical protein N7466_010281 [Penicillium verhagenii]